ncbi:MAG: hypothetical protein H6619_01605 [Deltaproteobacteria bacterium]|nr:hypothetical protein [Deltaproteobacteria bacterium]
MNFKTSGIMSVVCCILLCSVIAFRSGLNHEVNDPELEKVVKDHLQYLLNDLLVDDVSDSVKSGKIDQQKVSALANGVEIKQISAQGPLLSFSFKEDVVLRVDYEVPLEEAAGLTIREYYKAYHYRPNSWVIRYRTNPISYYANIF